MSARPRIVLLHATSVAMEPIQKAFGARWSDAEMVNLLDDGLSIDRAKTHDLTQELIERFVELGRYGARMGADGILVTCSAFGPAIDRMIAEFTIPVLKPNEAMFRAAIARGNRIGMLATFAPALPTMTAEFAEFTDETGTLATLDTIVVENAIDALRKGDAETHNRLIAEKALEMTGYDAVMLAHFSTSRAADLVRNRIDIPVLTAPDAAVDRMKALVLGDVRPQETEA